jgi:hypothetical protein
MALMFLLMRSYCFFAYLGKYKVPPILFLQYLWVAGFICKSYKKGLVKKYICVSLLIF